MAKGAPVISALPDDVWHDQTLASKFCIERELGVGGQAVVVAARHLQLDEYVALIVLVAGRGPKQGCGRALLARGSCRGKDQERTRCTHHRRLLHRARQRGQRSQSPQDHEIAAQVGGIIHRVFGEENQDRARTAE